MDLLINMANILYVIAYFTLDILRLRILTTAAAICLAMYFYSQPAPLMNVVGWNVFFVILNLVQICRISKSRYAKPPGLAQLPSDDIAPSSLRISPNRAIEPNTSAATATKNTDTAAMVGV